MKKETQFTHIGRPKAGLGAAVNPDITRASTLLFDRAEDLYRSDIRGYGRHGTAVHDALKQAFNIIPLRSRGLYLSYSLSSESGRSYLTNGFVLRPNNGLL